MHEIGDPTFWLDEDEIISELDAVDGIADAGNNIGMLNQLYWVRFEVKNIDQYLIN